MTQVEQATPLAETRAVGVREPSEPSITAMPVLPTWRPAPPRIDKRDPRYLALRNFAISMSVFNILGYTVLGFEQPWTWPILALAVGYTTDIVFEVISAWAQQRPAR